MKPQLEVEGDMPRESAIKRCNVVLERMTSATPTPTTATGGTVSRSFAVTDAAAESDSPNSMTSINSRTAMSPLARREALCTPNKESRFWRCRKRSRLDDGSSSDTSIPSSSGRKPRTGLRKAHRLEKDTQAEEEPRVSGSGDPEPKPVRSPAISLHTTVANTATEEVRKRIEVNLATVEKIAKASNHLKTTYVADLRNAAKAIREDADSLAFRTLTEETSALRAENERLRIRLDFLQNEMREMRLLMHRGPVAPAQTTELSRDFESRMIRQLEELIDARLKSLQPQPNPQSQLRLFNAADKAGNQVTGMRQESCSEVLEDMRPRVRATKTLSKIAQDVSKNKEVDGKMKGDKKKKKEKKKGKGSTIKDKEIRIEEPAPTLSPAVVAPTSRDVESPAIPTATSSGEGWTVVAKKGRASANKAQQAKLARHTVESGKASQSAKPRLRAPRSAAVVLTIPAEAQANGVTYAAVIKEARSKVDLKEAGIECVKFRQAVTGATVIQIAGPGSSDKADLLSVKLKNIFKDQNIKVSRPVKMADLRVSGLDASITATDLKEAIAIKGECSAEQIRVSQIQQDKTGLYAAWVNCPITAAKKVTESRFLVGWVAARVSVQKPRELRCFRCLEVGHVANRCATECDRSRLCYRCGQPDHKAANCTAKPNCIVCAAAGRKADHRLGGSGCSVDKAPKRRPNNPTAGSQAEGTNMETVEIVTA
ncbi:uncharacterized protein LOC123693129 [Colias croceus]|uniref:uncharacterized protein LOC123693129 n=1 Tax=Colias crocea TaxID=72248 RepID=UPI001E27B578|nr:uncharacterized protein LOC123693129 [Colias croceus]